MIPGATTSDAITMNRTPIAHEADVTALLRPRNELVLTRDTDQPPGEVRLEVRRGDSDPI